MLYAVIIILVFLGFGLQRVRSMYRSGSLITTILLIVFFNGIFDMLRVPPFLIKLTTEIIIIFLLIYTWSNSNKAGKPFHIPGMRIFFLFSIVVFLSVYLNNSNLYQSYLYYRFFLTPFLFMLVIVNSDMSEFKTYKLISFVEFLFIFQLVASIIKLVVLGRPEHPVGTIIVEGGGVATYVPLVASGFLVSRYFIYKKDIKYLYLLFAFPLIAFASQKRGTFIFLPLVFLVLLYFLGRIDPRSRIFKRRIKYFISLSAIAFILLIGAAKTTKTMNPEGSIFGSFDFNYLFESSVQYSNLEGEFTLGRFASYKKINEVMGAADWKHKLFGYGPETLKGATREDGKFEKFGVAGTYPGISYQFIQIGYLGAYLWVLLYLYYGYRIYLVLKREKDKFWKSLAMGSLVMVFLFLIDHFTYSITFITVYALTFTVALAFGLIKRRQYIVSRPKISDNQSIQGT